MYKLNLPAFSFSIKEEGGKKKIFDKIRKKYIALTPEEWVRQHFIMYLTDHLGYPSSLMAIEAKVNINGLSQRADIVVYNTQRKPILVVECKAPGVKISQAVFDQVVRYNSQLQTQCVVVTNGLQHYCAAIKNNGSDYQFLKEVPVYQAIR